MGKLTILGILVGLVRFVFGIKNSAGEDDETTNEELIKEQEKKRLKKLEEEIETDEEFNEDTKISTNIEDDVVECPACHANMRRCNTSMSDFYTMKIYECPECRTVSEFQYETETNKMMRIVHIMDRNASNSSAFMETEGIIDYKNFSLDRLWAIGGVLCYPVMIRTEFADRGSLVFIKVGDKVTYGAVEGFLINANDVVGQIKLMKSDSMSHFCNPYLANLPHPNYTWISSPTLRCAELEVVYNIRFNHRVRGHNGMALHSLMIIKDNPLRAMGMEVYIRFYCTNGFDGDKLHMPMSELIKKIDLEAIIMGESDIKVDEEYGIQAASVERHTLSSLNKKNISEDLRAEFFDDVRKFFWLYDKETRHEPIIEKDD